MMMRKMVVLWCGLAALLIVSGCRCPMAMVGAEPERGDVPNDAAKVRPILVGQPLPKIVLRTADNAPFELNAAIAEKPTVLIFFRGGWCPFCSRHLGQLQSIEAELVELGCQIIAVSPDRPELLNAPVEKQQLKYRLLSDSRMTAARALGIAFRLDDATVEKYKTAYGIDIEADSGQTHHLLPVPSAFVIGRDGVVEFSYVNPDYKVRIDPGVLLAAARAAVNKPVKN
ncbi:peroxiredoxin-like family protein [Candidatus Sumerlaeota bacterium]